MAKNVRILIAIISIASTTINAEEYKRFDKGWLGLDASFEMLLMKDIPFTFPGNDHLMTGAMMGFRFDARINIWPAFLLLRMNDYFPSDVDRHAFDTLSLKTKKATVDLAQPAIGFGINVVDFPNFRTSCSLGYGLTHWWAVVSREDSISGITAEDIKESHIYKGYFIESNISITPYRNLFINTEWKRAFDDNRSLFIENSIGWRIYNSKPKNAYWYLGLTYGYLQGNNFSYSTVGFSCWVTSSSK